MVASGERAGLSSSLGICVAVPMEAFQQLHSQSSTLGKKPTHGEKKKIQLFLNSGKGGHSCHFVNFVLFNQSCKPKSHFEERNLICVSRHCFGIQNLGS